jgi:hypothetical protein
MRWLYGHAALVNTITLMRDDRPADGEPDVQEFNKAITNIQSQRLLNVLQRHVAVATAANRSAAGSNSSAAPLHQASAQQLMQQQQQRMRSRQARQLHLASFSSNCFVEPELLAALQPHSLTKLDLDFRYADAISSSSLSTALARLSNLQQLRLANSRGYSASTLPGCCLSVVQQLSHLTSLELGGRWSEIDQRLQQLLSQPLQLRQLKLRLYGIGLPVLDIAKLKQLHAFGARLPMAQGTILPSQLQHLTVSCSRGDISNAEAVV